MMVNWPPSKTGTMLTGFQFAVAGASSADDSKTKPVKFVGHVSRTSLPERTILSGGGSTAVPNFITKASDGFSIVRTEALVVCTALRIGKFLEALCPTAIRLSLESGET